MKWLTASKTCIDTDKFIVRRWIARRAQKLWRQHRYTITASTTTSSSGSSSNAFDVYKYCLRSGWQTCTHPTVRLHLVRWRFRSIAPKCECDGGGAGDATNVTNKSKNSFFFLRGTFCVGHPDQINSLFVVSRRHCSHLWTEHVCHIFSSSPASVSCDTFLSEFSSCLRIWHFNKKKQQQNRRQTEEPKAMLTIHQQFIRNSKQRTSNEKKLKKKMKTFFFLRRKIRIVRVCFVGGTVCVYVYIGWLVWVAGWHRFFSREKKNSFERDFQLTASMIFSWEIWQP